MGHTKRHPKISVKIFALGLIFTISHASGETSIKNRIRIQKKSHLTASDLKESEDLNLDKGSLLAGKRKNLIQDIRKFIRESKSADQIAELNLRLGGLYLEDYRWENGNAQRDFDKATEAFRKSGAKGKAPKFDNSLAMANLDKSRAIYRDLANRYKTHPRRDEMLYFLGLTSIDKGNTNEAMNTFDQLVREYPSSQYSNDAIIQVADHHFENNRFPQAEAFYNKIVAKKFKPLLPYAVYKQGWCAYNTQRPGYALSQFKWVIENEENIQGSGTTIRVKQEAIRDITLPFVDLKKAQEGMEFFKNLGEGPYRQGLETMASLFFEQGDHPHAIELNEALLAIDANYKKNPTYEISIIESLHLKNDRQQAINRLFERLPSYLQNSNWYEIQVSQPEIVKQASNDFEELARKYALQYHAEGQKTQNTALYEVAKNLYAKYLEFFPTTTQSPKIRFYLAEIQFRDRQYVAAGTNYHQVFKTPAAGALRSEAIRNALQSFDLQINEDRKKAGLAEISSKSKDKLKDDENAVLEASPLSPVEAKFIEVSNDYLAEFPKAKEAADVLYQQAYLHYVHFDLVTAYKGFWKLVETYPGHATSYPSGFLILDVLNRRKDYGKMVLAAQKFLDTKALDSAPFRSEVGNVQRHAELKRIAQLEEKGSYKEAADAYNEYTKAHGAADEALFEKALYNASVNYLKAGTVATALETEERFLRRFPKSGFRENMLLQVAKTYESLANLEKSAVYFDSFSQEFPRNEQASSAMRLAGLYYWGSGNSPKAEATLLNFIGRYPKDKKQAERDLLAIYDSRGANDAKAQYLLKARAEKGIAMSEYLHLTVRLAELQAKATGRIQRVLMDEALGVVQKFSKVLGDSPKAQEAISKVLFWQANQKEEMFSRIKLVLPQARLEKNLANKLALIKELETDYTRIAKMGGDWGLGALLKTASLYRQMSDELMQAPVPAELTAEQLDIYRAELQKQMVKPFREKATALASQCLDKAQEFNLLSSWTPKCYSLAGELEPTRYPIVKTFYLPATQVAVLLPNKESKIALGDFKTFRYPFGSAGLFNIPSPERTLASVMPPSLPTLYGGLGVQFDDSSRAVPSIANYRSLSDERKAVLQKALDSARPNDPKQSSFAYLNLLRQVNPHRSIPSLMEAIQKDPNNSALHALLGLAYQDAGNTVAARVTFLSLVARGITDPAIWNNLGVLESQEGNEEQSIAYFKDAAENDSKEALINLGYLALKYRNGFEAKKHFEKAMSLDSALLTAEVGLSIARIQNRELDSAKDGLLTLQKNYKSDPLTNLSLTYFLMDSEKETPAARQLIGEYVQSRGLQNDTLFREAVQEAQRGPEKDNGSLPGIE